jgi:hypothetical protein
MSFAVTGVRPVISLRIGMCCIVANCAFVCAYYDRQKIARQEEFFSLPFEVENRTVTSVNDERGGLREDRRPTRPRRAT